MTLILVILLVLYIQETPLSVVRCQHVIMRHVRIANLTTLSISSGGTKHYRLAYKYYWNFNHSHNPFHLHPSYNGGTESGQISRDNWCWSSR